MSERGSNNTKCFQKCVECGGTRLTKYENDNIICADCGLVTVLDIAGHNSDWNPSCKRQEMNNANAYMKTLTPYNNGFTPLDDRIDRDLNEHDALDEKLRTNLHKMWWTNAKVSDATEKNLALAFLEITKLGRTLSLPESFLEKAATTYKKIAEKRYVKGRNIRTLSTAAVYMACKQYGFIRTLDEVTTASGTDREDVGRSYRFLVRQLGCSVPLVKPRQYLPRLLDRLALSEKALEITCKILEAAEQSGLTSGRNPVGLAAAATYIASMLTGEERTQREIAEVARITEATIRNRYKELAKHLLFTMSL